MPAIRGHVPELPAAVTNGDCEGTVVQGKEVLVPDPDLETEGDVDGGVGRREYAEAVEAEADDLDVGVGGPEEEDGRRDEDGGDEEGRGGEEGATAAAGASAAPADGVGWEEDVCGRLAVGVSDLGGGDAVGVSDLGGRDAVARRRMR